MANRIITFQYARDNYDAYKKQTITALSKQNINKNGKNVGAIGIFVNGYDEWYGLLSNAGDSSVTDLLYMIPS